jgi:hypothetical protein
VRCRRNGVAAHHFKKILSMTVQKNAPARPPISTNNQVESRDSRPASGNDKVPDSDIQGTKAGKRQKSNTEASRVDGGKKVDRDRRQNGGP